MVVLSIIVVITTVVLTSQNSFNKTIILSNTAYDIALTLRSAQTFGIGSRARDAIHNAGYGIHFLSGSPSSFTLFADTSPPASCGEPDCKPGDKVYASSDALVQVYDIGNGISIDNFCALLGGNWTCAREGLSSLDIVFARPNPDASIRSSGGSVYTAACISVASPQSDARRYVSVAASGQIIANAAACPP